MHKILSGRAVPTRAHHRAANEDDDDEEEEEEEEERTRARDNGTR
tara:strand:- start:180 stop:314 length:135 start_codon:yes stop_codon:yes gene_type:complete